MADAYLPIVVKHLPAHMFFDDAGLRPKIASYVRQGVVRVIAGAERCHVVIDIRRLYSRPPHMIEAPFIEVSP